MKKIRVTVRYEMEIPDDWQVMAPCEDETEHLLIDGKYYSPDLQWMEYEGQNADGTRSYVGADDEMENLIGDHLRVGVELSIKRIRRFSMVLPEE